LKAVHWQIRIGNVAEKDFLTILKYTRNNFGVPQALIYKELLLKTLSLLAYGPNVIGSKSREEILPNLRSLHVSRNGQRGRHIIFYIATQNNIIEIIRILHDAMDLAKNIITDNA
jgi:toxin ParE1/3/4